MSNNGTDPISIARQLQRIQEKRMYLSQQQYSRESEERTNVSNKGHSRSVLIDILQKETQGNKTVQHPSQIMGSSLHQRMSARTSRSSANPLIEGTAVLSVGTSRPSTSNQETITKNNQINLRQELLMEVLSQFENGISSQQNNNVEFSKRKLNSDNGVAFDWGKLPRIGSVHSVHGIVGPERVKTSSTVATKESGSEESLSRMGKIKMAELARLILNGTFDNLLGGSSPEDQSAGSVKTTAAGLNSASQGKGKDFNQALRVERQVSDPLLGSSSQDMVGNGRVPANDSHSSRKNTQQEATANQIVPPFNQCSANLNTTGSFDLQSNQRTSHNATSPFFTTSGRYDFQLDPATSYNTNNGNLTAARSYDSQSNRRINYNVNTSNLCTSGNYNLQSNQRTSYNTGASIRAASVSYDRQSSQRTSYNTGASIRAASVSYDRQSSQKTSFNTSFGQQNLSHMTQVNTPGIYGRTPVRLSYPRSLNCSVSSAPGNNSSYIRHPLTSIPRGVSIQRAGMSANRDQRVSYPFNRDFQSINRTVRTARVEPLSNPTNIVHPSSRGTHATTASSPGSDVGKNAEHDSNSCLDCRLLGTCPVKKAVAAANLASEKEREQKSSSDEEPELIITKVTTKDAERGPIERIDVDEWVSSSESCSETIKVKQEPLDVEEVARNHEEKCSAINNVVNQMRLMAKKLLTEDGVLDLGTSTEINEQNSNSDSISIQDTVVGSQQVAIPTVASVQPTPETTESGVQDGITEISTTVCQEVASKVSEERNAFRDHGSEEIATDELTASEVIEKSIVENHVPGDITMETRTASKVIEENIDQNTTEGMVIDKEFAPELNRNILQNPVTDDITMDMQSSSVVTAKSIAQNPVTITAMDTQTSSKVIEESFVQEHATKDSTIDTQLTPKINQESITQGYVTEVVTMGKQPASEGIEENLNQGHVTDDVNVDRQTALEVIDTVRDADPTKRNSSNEGSTATVDHDNHPLASLTKIVKSLEGCVQFLKQRATESEYDKGDRNYKKYALMEGAELAVQENDKTEVINAESIDNSDTSRRPSLQPVRVMELSLQDQEIMEKLERELEENQEKLKDQNDLSIRKRYLEERLFMLKKIERTRQKYEMSLQDREAIDCLEKRLEINKEKLKNQNVAWIRKNCLKARLMIFKKINRIRLKYGFQPEEPPPLSQDSESRNVQDNVTTSETGEEEAAPEVNTLVPVVENESPLDAISDRGNVYELRIKTADSLEMPETDSGMNQYTQRLSNEMTDQEAEEVTSEEETALDSITTGFDTIEDYEERDPVLSEETHPLVDPSLNNGLPENAAITSKSIQDTDVEGAFNMEDVIKEFVEHQEDENFGERTSTPSSPSSLLEGPSPLQDNQENSTRSNSPDKGQQDQSDKSVLEKTTTINLSTESIALEILSQSSKTNQVEEVANTAGDNPPSKNIVRKKKRKSDTKEEHVVIKKEKIDEDQQSTSLEEKSYNIWDFIKKYSKQ